MALKLTGDLSERAWAISQSMDEPAWAKRERRVGRLVTGGLGLPSPKEEKWRRTDLGRLGLDLGQIKAPAPALLEPVAITGDDQVAWRLPTAVAADMPLCQAMCRLPEPEDLLEALHRALWSDGVLVDLPAGYESPAPLRIHLPTPLAYGSVFYILLVHAGEGSRGTIIIEDEDDSSDGPEGPRLSYTHVELKAAAGAAVNVLLQHRRQGLAYDFLRLRAHLQSDSALDFTAVAHAHPGVFRAGMEAVLGGPGASARARFLYTAGEKSVYPTHLDLGGTIWHQNVRTRSRLVMRGVLAGEARAVLRGFADVQKNAAGSEAYQHMQSLLLDRRARADSIPALKIDENDVKAGHATAAGPLDREQLFYLQSRGLDLATARRLMVAGFFAPVLADVPADLAALAQRALGLVAEEAIA